MRVKFDFAVLVTCIFMDCSILGLKHFNSKYTASKLRLKEILRLKHGQENSSYENENQQCKH